MGSVIILPETVKNPITMIGRDIGICYGSDISDDKKNYRRGMNSILAGHGRVLEFADVHLALQGWSARTIRQWYTHIGGSPTRVQESTRYIDYSNFKYITPPAIQNDEVAAQAYEELMEHIIQVYHQLKDRNIKKEDCANVLPLGMETGICCKHNARNLMNMVEQRSCTRAYWEYRDLIRVLLKELHDYSEEWATLSDVIFKCKCDKCGYCVEEFSCGKYPKIKF